MSEFIAMIDILKIPTDARILCMTISPKTERQIWWMLSNVWLARFQEQINANRLQVSNEAKDGAIHTKWFVRRALRHNTTALARFIIGIVHPPNAVLALPTMKRYQLLWNVYTALTV